MKTLINDGLKFVCETEAELWRARTLLTKEPGTIAWLKMLGPGDVFYDVGANVGCYTLYAARRAKHVYAFEPHLANALSLMRNVAANGMAQAVTVLTLALHRESQCMAFYYRSLEAGSSGSQFGHIVGEDGLVFCPVAVEVKAAAALGDLIRDGVLPPPDAMKVDVDGNEAFVLGGLVAADGPRLPRTVQVETRAANRDFVATLMRDYGYAVLRCHRTQSGEAQLVAGAEQDSITNNTIFERAA